MIEGHETFEEDILDFRYRLFDVKRYEEKELYEIAKKTEPQEYRIFMTWCKMIFKEKFSYKLHSRLDSLFDNVSQKEGEKLTHNLERVLEKMVKEMEQKGMEEGQKKKAIAVARNLLKLGNELKKRKEIYEGYKERIKTEGIGEISTTDPDSRLMAVNNN